ncbi:MAG: hypothetical protein HKN87_11215 [Saprospiraceae bacterium]|nr:hypothetical protein [Saprospiraceae bacterium]
MKENRLEEFIRQHRDEFDDDNPSLEVWSAISKQVSKSDSSGRISWIRHAAAVGLLLIGVALGMLLYHNIFDQSPVGAHSHGKDLEEIEQYFVQQVAVHTKQLEGFVQATEDERDLMLIDEAIKDLKRQLADAPRSARNKLIEAIITTYETKIAMLEKVIKEKISVESTI